MPEPTPWAPFEMFALDPSGQVISAFPATVATEHERGAAAAWTLPELVPLFPEHPMSVKAPKTIPKPTNDDLTLEVKVFMTPDTSTRVPKRSILKTL
jgi:hypothetical protein